jgi:hypothetical protein
MRRVVCLAIVLLLAGIVGSPLPARAQAASDVNGGGTAAGPDTSSQFGMGIDIAGDGSVAGHFARFCASICEPLCAFFVVHDSENAQTGDHQPVRIHVNAERIIR